MIFWILSLSAAFAVALNGTMVMPVVVMTIGRLPGYDEATATLVASTEIAGIALYSLAFPRLAARHGRPVVLAGFAMVIAGEAASYWLTGRGNLAMARLLVGLGEGAIFGGVASTLASLANAERLWGIINLIGGTAMGFLLLGLALVPVETNGSPIFLVLAAFAVAMAPLALVRRERANEVKPATAIAPLDRRQLVLAFVTVLMVYAVQAGQWAISGFVAELSQLTAGELGVYLAISSVAGFVGAIVPSTARDRTKRLACVLIGFAIMAASLYAFFNIRGEYVFLVSQICLNIGFYIVTPFLTGLLTESDRDGALLSRILVLALGGAAIGTAVAGPLFSNVGPSACGSVFMFALALAAAAAVAIFRRPRLAHRVDSVCAVRGPVAIEPVGPEG